MISSPRRTSVVTLLVAVLGALLLLPGAGSATTFTQGVEGTVSGNGGQEIAGYLAIEPLDPATPMVGGGEMPSGGYTPGDCLSPCRIYVTEADGTFNVPLAPGQYLVRFAGYHLAPEWWGDSALRDGTEITITPDTFLSTDVVLQPGGSITGNVAQASGQSDSLIEAWVADPGFPGGYFVMSVSVAEDNGDYTLPNLPDAAYLLHFINRRTKLEGWWQGKTTIGASDPVQVNGGATVTGIDPTLAPFGSFSGRVTRAADGSGVGYMNMDVWRLAAPGHWVQDTVSGGTTSDGTYSFPIHSGTYRVRFYGDTDLKSEFWSGASTYQTGQDVVVGIGDNVTGIDATLEPKAMVRKTVPVVSGTARVGNTLTVSYGGWYPTPTSYSYRWISGGYVVGTAKTYVLRPSDVGRIVHAQVTASRPDHTSTTSSLANSGQVAQGVFRLNSAAELRGTPRVGLYLRAVAPQSTPSAVVKYRWYRDGHLISGKTWSRYTMVSADRGHRISVHITLSRTGYATVVRGAQTSTVVH